MVGTYVVLAPFNETPPATPKTPVVVEPNQAKRPSDPRPPSLFPFSQASGKPMGPTTTGLRDVSGAAVRGRPNRLDGAMLILSIKAAIPPAGVITRHVPTFQKGGNVGGGPTTAQRQKRVCLSLGGFTAEERVADFQRCPRGWPILRLPARRHCDKASFLSQHKLDRSNCGD